MKITDVRGREILDSRGNPTVEVEVTLDGGAQGPRRGAVRGIDRRARGARAARRRQVALSRQGRAQSGRQRQRRDRVIDQRQGVVAASARRSDDRARRHADQEPPRRQRAARRVDGGDAGGGGTRGQAAVRAHRGARGPITGSGGNRVHAAGADDEHPQRRRARGFQRRLPGIHGDADRLPVVQRGIARRRRDLPRAAIDPEGPRPLHRRR